MIFKKLHLILLILIVTDISYSFVQHYHIKLDGDMAHIIVPSKGCEKVMNDPFGFNVLFKGEVYNAPNRYFAHLFMTVYFKSVPLFLQYFVSPVDSIYLACAIAKTLIQIFIIYLLSIYISGNNNFFRKEFLIAALLVTPLFQTSEYNAFMGIIDKSITYTFFYALPLSFLLVFFLPFYRKMFLFQKIKLSKFSIISLFILAVVLSFNGPIIPGVIVIVCSLIIIKNCADLFMESLSLSLNQRFHKIIKSFQTGFLPLFIFTLIISGYSIFIGMNNIENSGIIVPVIERYSRLPAGFYYLLTTKLGPSLLLLAVIINSVILKKGIYNAESKRLLNILKWIGIFSLIYTLILPLGGFRIYRSNIIRRDTIMPVIICMIYI